jgi:hypothetical protein
LDKFRIRGGDFIGIIIPGVILLSNVYLIYWKNINDLLMSIFGTNTFTLNENVIVFLIFLIIAYVVGIVLRLLSPDIPDKFSILIRLIATFNKIGIKRINGVYNNTPNSYYPLRGFYQKFPYFTWFMEYIRKSMPDIFKFYNNYLDFVKAPVKKNIKHTEWLTFLSPFIVFGIVDSIFSIKIAFYSGIGFFTLINAAICLKGFSITKNINRNDYKDDYPDDKTSKDFLNYCKLVVLEKSSRLGEEVLFAEGLSRMVCGSFYAIVYSITVLVLRKISELGSLKQSFINLISQPGLYSILFGINLLLLFIIIWGVHHVRVKEAMTVFSAYGIVMTVKDETPPDDNPI